jgi:hypothetical protein
VAGASSGTVPMFDPESGKTIPVSASKVEQLQALGFTVDSPEAAEKRAYESKAGAGELATSVGEGLASGATLGLSDVLASAVGGEDYLHRRALRDQTFEGPHKLAEGVGMVAPMLIPGGAELEGAEAAGEGGSLLSRAAGYLPTSLAAKAAGGVEGLAGRGLARLGEEGASKGLMRSALEAAVRHGAAGATEGALQGAGQGLSEQALAEEHGGFDQLAESAWAGARSGAMFGLFGGAAMGGLTGATEGAGRGLFRRFGAKGDELAEAANERAVKATGARGADLRRLGSEGKIQEVGEDIRKYTLKDGTPLLGFTDNAESLAPKLAAARAEQGASIGGFRERVANTEPTDLPSQVNHLGLENTEYLREGMRDLRVHRGAYEGATPEEVQKIALGETPTKNSSRPFEPVTVSAEPDGSFILQDGRHRLTAAREAGADKVMAKIRRTDAEGNIVEEVTAPVSIAKMLPEPGAFPDAAGLLSRIKTEVTDPLLKSDSLRTRGLASQVDDQFAGIREAVTKGEPIGMNRLLDARKDIQGRVYGLEKQMRGPNPPPAPELDHLRRAERLLDDAIDTHMRSKLSHEDFGKYKEAKRLYSSFAPADKLAEKAVGQNIGNRFFSPTDYATGIGTAASMVAGGSVLGPVAGLATAIAHKEIRERGSAFLATLATRAMKVDGGIERSLDRYFSRVSDRLQAPHLAVGGAVSGTKAGFDVAKALHATPGEHAVDAYDRLVARTQAYANGNHETEYALDEHAPQTGSAMRQVQLRAAQYLMQNAPVPPRKTSNPNLSELNNQMRPDPVALYEFARRVAAVNEPLSVLKDLQTGHLSMVSVDAVRNVYPQLYQSMQIKVLEKLGAQPKAIAYEDRIRLGLMFQIPTDTSLRPENLAAAQQTYAQQNTPPTPKNMPPVNLSKKIESQTERLETGDLAQ